MAHNSILDSSSLRLALDSSGIAVWTLDPQSGLIAWTETLGQFFGVPAEHPIDYAFVADRTHADDRPALNVAVESALNAAGDGKFVSEHRILTPDGSVRWIMTRGQAFFDGDGTERKAVALIGTARDVTDRKAADDALQAALEQQQVLLKEVNHRVKNSLQLVSSLLRLQARRIADPAMRHQLEDAMTRISTIAHLHQRLYRDQDVKRIDFRAFLTELCADLQASSPTCSISVEAPAIRIPTDRAIPLALIVNELVTNAFKYAYPGKPGGGILVAVTRPGANDITVCVSDEGVGLPSDFSVDKTESLGMILINSLLGQLGGKIDLLPREKGTAFAVSAAIDEG